MNPIVEALGPAPGLGHLDESEITKKIVNDNLVMLRAQERMVEFFAATALERMNPLERAALIKRITPSPVVGATKNLATWTMHEGMSDGRPYLQGKCLACNQDVRCGGPAPRQHVNRLGVSEADVARGLDFVSFAHCGHVEKLPADFRAYAERIFQRIVDVTEERP